MGYTTEFKGQFSVTPALTPEHRAYLAAFAETRRMRRDAAITETMPDPVREAVGLPVGPDGSYYVGSTENYGQNQTPDILNYNAPGGGQPELWCQWVPNVDGTAIEWDGGEKFYSYVEWLRYLILNFLAPWGYTLDGAVAWQGESRDDRGVIVVANNHVGTR